MATQTDLFITAFVDASPRDQRDAMEFPFFALGTKQRKPIKFYQNGVKVEIIPSSKHALVSIHDWDFIQWLMSQINAEIEAGNPSPSSWIEFSPATFIIQTARVKNGKASGKHYQEFKAMIDRLASTYYDTSISAGGKTMGRKFHLITDVKYVEDDQARPVRWRVQVSEWIYNKVVRERSVLALDERYFTLRKGLIRKCYLWARKHCGSNENWSYPLRKFWERCGSSMNYGDFRKNLLRALKTDAAKIPEYEVWVYREDNGEWRMRFELREGVLAQRKAPQFIRRQLEAL